MTTLRNEAKKIAEALLDAAEVEKPPVSFDPIIVWVKYNLKFDLTVINDSNFLSRNGLSGKLVRMGTRVFILINNREPVTRQRFTLAHEFGHLMESHDVAHMSQVMPAGYNKERFADIFATELLMPADIVKTEWSKLRGIINPAIVQYNLAKIFNVSNEAMGYRLNELGLQSKQWAGIKVPPVYQ